ncbi:MAG: hypothetical protein JW788_02085 [Candidatus Omnitrophica bacterium]|nr:hypothetical protein [Candidatus Omnitrophota bacterium]
MNKKEIYEHLANIYLDASHKRKKKSKKFLYFKTPVLTALSVIFTFSLLFSFVYLRNDQLTFKKSRANIALVFKPDVGKINFDFSSAKKEVFSIGLSKLNLTDYKMLGFSLRKKGGKGEISLRVELSNNFMETSEVYVKSIPTGWQDYKIDLGEFKNISNWKEMSEVAFVVEEWNAKDKQGVVYIDNIRFLR